jgi:hypothetical protein
MIADAARARMSAALGRDPWRGFAEAPGGIVDVMASWEDGMETEDLRAKTITAHVIAMTSGRSRSRHAARY